MKVIDGMMAVTSPAHVRTKQQVSMPAIQGTGFMSLLFLINTSIVRTLARVKGLILGQGKISP